MVKNFKMKEKVQIFSVLDCFMIKYKNFKNRFFGTKLDFFAE